MMGISGPRVAWLLGALLAAGGAHAQARYSCPDLPADNLSWQATVTDSYVLCRAVEDGGREVFGLHMASESAFRPRRGNREKRGTIDGHPIRWYRGEYAADPERIVRETLLELDKGRVVHIWLHASNREELDSATLLVEKLEFGPARLSSN